jgi:hypothetical protein
MKPEITKLVSHGDILNTAGESGNTIQLKLDMPKKYDMLCTKVGSRQKE